MNAGQSFRSRAPNLLWAVYAPIYDVLLVLKPYTTTLATICEVLVRTGAQVVLDAGCGTGNLALYATQYDIPSIWGVDSSPAMLTIARLKQRLWHRQMASNRFVQADLNIEATLPRQKFDAIVSIGVLHAVGDPQQVVRNLVRHVRPNGSVVLVLPLPVSAVGIIREHLSTASVGRLALSILLLPLFVISIIINLVEESWAKGGRMHFFTEAEARALVEQSGLRIEECRPVFGDAYTLIIATQSEDDYVV